ncbi:MAG: sugar ABC transporter ATP-binding protein, partial [Planctomycetia bacterium]
VVFDEPTSSLGPAEAERLFGVVRRLQADGVAVVYVTHKLNEVLRLCDACTVLRDGKVVFSGSTAGATEEQLIRWMVGREVGATAGTPAPTADAPVRLSVRSLSSPGRFHDVSFDVRRGEILGLAGLVGAGRSEIADAVFGVDRGATGEVVVDGVSAIGRTPLSMAAMGVGFIPEDRKRQGLVLDFSVERNTTLAVLDRLRGWFGAVRTREERAEGRRWIERLKIKTPAAETAARGLSGGNQQKIVLAKWLAAGCGVLIVDEPTRGVDVGAKQEIHRLIQSLAADGAALLLISSDLPELLALSTRVAAVRKGRLVGCSAKAEADPETIARAMAGW